MTEIEVCLSRLTDKDAAAAYAWAQNIAGESRKSRRWYEYVEAFAALLRHKNSLVRNRAISILAANARWDTEDKYPLLLDELLAHVTDEKPITARQCIQALPEIAEARPDLAERIRAALENADLSSYRDSMQPLILKDIMSALSRLS